jgi:hypothetical protein
MGNDSLTSFAGLDNIVSIEGDVVIFDNTSLDNLTGLDNLTTIDGSLYLGYFVENYDVISILGNPSLTNLSGLGNVTSIEGNLWIIGNDILTEISGLENVTSIDGNLLIKKNSALNSLSGLTNTTTIGGSLQIGDSSHYWWGNLSLISLSGLDNIAASTINYLTICRNYSLSTCAVQSVCDYLASPGAIIEIHNNATGCNSPEEVDSACVFVGINQFQVSSSRFQVEVYPNPTSGVSSFRFQVSGSQHITLKIYDIHGREIATVVDEVMQEGEHIVRFDVSKLPAGVYIYKKLDNWTVGSWTTGKLIIY